MQTASRRQFLTTTVLGAASSLGKAVESPQERIRIAQIGTGHSHAAGKLAAIKKHANLFDVVGLATAEPANGEVYEGVPRLSEKDILEDKTILAVVVETAMDQACSTAKRAIEAGKHIHLDKPGALKHAEFSAMRMDAAKRGLTVQMGYMLRYNPAFTLLFRAVKEGWLGEITEVDAMIGSWLACLDMGCLSWVATWSMQLSRC
jgi:predicted dehydrogenase